VSWREQRRRAQTQSAPRRAPARDESAPDQPDIAFRLAGVHVDTDAVFAFALFTPLVFMVQFATLGAAAVAGLTPIYVFLRRRQLVQALAPRAFLLAFPVLALFSVLWSEAPRQSLRFALELSITVIAALLLCSARNQRAVLRAIALAFLIYAVDALTVGRHVAVGMSGGAAFSGLTGSKNLMAEIASTGLIVSLAVAMMAISDGAWLWVAIACVAIPTQLYCVAAARSAGALVGLAMGLAPLFVLSPLAAAGKAARAWLVTTLAVALGVVGLSYQLIVQAMLNLTLHIFNKDPTLTGRTYLWYRGFDLIREKPLLGRGYQSFWLQGNIDAEGLWRFGGITDRGGFSFHNTLVDLLVTVGWVGAAVMLVLVGIGAVALLRRYVSRPSLPLVFWIAILLYELSRAPFETLGFQPFAFSTVLVFGALGVACGRPPPPRPRRIARTIQVQPVDYAREVWSNPRLADARGSLRIRRRDEPAG
jgi:exopolysaccharide production protein ExoQ